jgi:uncharacterized protein YbjT (DUF2867 family)
MNVVVFGASGMVGKGVLLECIDDPRVKRALVLGRSSCGVTADKVEEVLLPDMTDYSKIGEKLEGLDACFFCLGVSSVGMSEQAYRRVTYDITVAAAEALIEKSPGLTFIYVSGQGTDETAKGSLMWARVKGETENRILGMPFKAAFMFRPGVIEPLRGVRPKAALTRAAYAIGWALFPILRATSPRLLTTTAAIGKAMIKLALEGSDRRYFENADINALVAS